MAHHCSTLVLHCIDFRFGKTIKEYLEGKGLLGDADIVAVAGGAKNIADPKFPSDTEFLLRQIDTSKQLHDIHHVVLMNHTDCGAYGGRAAFPDAAAERARLCADLRKAALVIQTYNPRLEVSLSLAVIDGETVRIEEIE
ncbi:hypothetical protein A3F28_01235 [Candidatus Uhrbacteria bacterium RIFCSPHIGHO2_12_FULL_57_11]|uniref:Carbonic anhydrase n=2 Tax=Candidatus Uhriibacteriota TaxID=1752732 RepID=A0A1F7UMH2_9BACT|nr:MAG: hypothetical protein A3D72_02080 [Candidatus Uhrbacteria bacterium RIFCSPHIGHO2_02_FULL_57_19]OGL79462.1 MAG: hypothetical protein A3F28_01235 [Candidatus Uhrbacteria bacterium RIFCSPHIGHO2_12_FULL_57_11]